MTGPRPGARSVPPARNIKHTSIRIGDCITIHYTFHDMKMTRTAVVAKRDIIGRSTEYRTAQGAIIFTVFADGTTDMHVKRIVWLSSSNDTVPDITPLFDID